MVTTKRELKKVSDDCSKLHAARLAQERRGRPVKAWLITFFEPTRDQKETAKDMGTEILSLDQFRMALLDAGTYLNARWAYRFGSATDPESQTTTLSEEEYVPRMGKRPSGMQTGGIRRGY